MTTSLNEHQLSMIQDLLGLSKKPIAEWVRIDHLNRGITLDYIFTNRYDEPRGFSSKIITRKQFLELKRLG